MIQPQSISVIIPVYNTGAGLLKKCLNSCLSQTYGNFQILLIDDGSTATETLSAIASVASENPNKIKVFSIKNAGAALARKYGVTNADSDFIFFLDADDFLEKDAFQLLMEAQNQTQADVVVGQFNLVSEKGTQPIRGFKIVEGENRVIRSFLMSTLPITLWANLYKTALFENVTFYNYTVGEDMVINAQIFSKQNIQVAVIDAIIYNYLQHDKSLTKQRSNAQTNQGYSAYKKHVAIILNNLDNATLQFELCLSRLNTLYAAIILGADKEVLLELRKDINHTESTIKGEALQQLTLKKRCIVNPILIVPASYSFVRMALAVMSK